MRILEKNSYHSPSPSPSQMKLNRILAELPEHELSALSVHMQEIELVYKKVLIDYEDEIEFIFFPIQGVISIITMLEDGQSVEVGLVGSEQCTPNCILFGERLSPYRNLVQVSGHALRLPVADLPRLLRENPAFEKALYNGVYRLGMTISQAAVCGQLHEAQERLARWILMVDDRSQLKPMPLTHELLSQMLGSRRATVSIAAAHLQNDHLIEYSRGKLTLLNRTRLEERACECYERGKKYS